MDITGKITGIKYTLFLVEDLKVITIENFNINEMPSSCLLSDNNHSFAISKWVSPKRTRSYPFERVFNTLNTSKKITVIPIVKDEGAKGDRDFIQWDTISLMSLLDVYIIFAYYNKADKVGEKISNQQFDNEFVIHKIKEIEQYHSSALHWNLNEINTHLHDLIDKVKLSYTEIEKTTGIKLHNSKGLDNFKAKIGKDVSLFMEFSREKAKQAQSREFITLQPKESLSTLSKAKITITNYLGGKYFLTVDEILITENTLNLIEGKHSKNALLPSKGDIKDGLLKMILYANLTDVSANGETKQSQAILKLSSSKLIGSITSNSVFSEIVRFITVNKMNSAQTELINILFKEAQENKFIIQIQYSK